MGVARDRIDAYLKTGLRNRWYPVMPSWRIDGAPVGMTRLGENIVMWRESNGRVHAIEDRCPHRGARLSLGWNLGDRLACWYHGIEIDGTGKVRNVPAVDACPIEGRQCVRAYAVREAKGVAYLWFGDELHAQPGPLELPEQLHAPEWEAMSCIAHWDCNWQFAVDNVMDPMHGTYLHAISHSMTGGNKQSEMRLSKTDLGVRFEKVDQKDVNFDWVEWGDTGTCWMRLSIPYVRKFGPGGPFFIIAQATPIDEDHTLFVCWRCRRVQGWQRDVWQFLYRNRLEKLHWDVLEQDRTVLENMAPGARDREFLYQHDVGLARVRRMLGKSAAEYLEALDSTRRE